MIFFDNNKNAYGFEIPNYIATIDDTTWEQYANTDKWDIINGQFVDISGTEEYNAQKLREAKAKKYNEANAGARTYLESGDALFEFVRHAEGHSELVSESENPATLKQVQGDNAESFHIEATDGNIAKLSAYALSFITGVMQPTDTVYWNTKEDETITLNQDELAQVLTGLGQVQALVWTVQFPAYVAMIESAKTPEEVNAIVIDYDNVLAESDEVKEDVKENSTKDNEVVENDV